MTNNTGLQRISRDSGDDDNAQMMMEEEDEGQEGGQSPGEGDMDEVLYSRQLYVFGHDAQRRLQASRVLVSGSCGLAAEICKNLALSGVGAITLHDQGTSAGWAELGSNFFLTAEDVEQQDRSKMETIRQRVSELNPSVRVALIPRHNLIDSVAEHDVLVLVGATKVEQEACSQLTRLHGKALVATDARGLCGFVFSDFGPRFVVDDGAVHHRVLPKR